MLVVEIMDEDGNVIKEEGKQGRVIVTSPKVKLQPVSRYPVGDIAKLVDYKCGHFEFPGREAARVKIYGYSFKILINEETVVETLGDGFIGNLRILRRFHDGKEEIVLRFNQDFGESLETARRLELNLISKVSAWQKLLEGESIHQLRIERAAMEDFVYNPNSGKLIRYVDEA
jgi:phenylacetate-CoA ligase